MPLLKSSIEAARKTKKMTLINRSTKHKLRVTEKKLLSLKTHEEASKLLKILIPNIQRAALKNIFPKNTGARKVSKYTRYVNSLKGK
ncbi:MAG: hypothetical protein A2452_06135 [Candidatus Firestonebacteria bacterium RIFOXYC2_FULL_39_67]|nr:MAG: hypothetical protein A2536_12330 [Candidatus Firestonebacteria bacterium RIFOXYD2_FULL_39_29]OGF56166.1 MAG: hypothetical protein A2497_05575 [Candidatus Firestonebacteria bacterium RifOxyC12_full_39_7]OGF56665.1 MAG: hypothetical protein A2452_06135 [Candidatus Firestonebacteria bacterium RIFOXYC2_FULL_39_67]